MMQKGSVVMSSNTTRGPSGGLTLPSTRNTSRLGGVPHISSSTRDLNRTGYLKLPPIFIPLKNPRSNMQMKCSSLWDMQTSSIRDETVKEKRKRDKDVIEVSNILKEKENKHTIIHTEKDRRKQIKIKQRAAIRIQRAWRHYRKNKVGIIKLAKQSVRTMRLQQGAEEFEKQIAALTIQLAWRKFYRRKLLRQLHPNKRQLRMWDPEVIAMKQQALVKQVYGEQLPAPFWHPEVKRQIRPYWSRWIPSAAAQSYNFAVDRYHPLMAKKGFLPTPFLDDLGYPKDFNWGPIEDMDFLENLKHLRVPTAKTRSYSYHLVSGSTTSPGRSSTYPPTHSSPTRYSRF